MKKIAVKDIASFIYSSGDLTNEYFQNNSFSDGKQAHSFLQKKYNKESEKEYYIKYTTIIKGEEYIIHGFIDGVLNEDSELILEEIKSTKENLDNIDLEYHKEHLAQLKLYAYLYCEINEIKQIHIRLRYIKIEDYSTKSFDLYLKYEDLKDFFFTSLNKYIDWLNIIELKDLDKVNSINNIKFPFPSERIGQRELMKATFYTLTHDDILYSIAPTGIGKTMATLFPALKSISTKYDKLFYLTAKTSGRTVVIDSVKLLMNKGLKLKTLVLSSKQKSCLKEEKRCKTEKCEYAIGYFNRLRDALTDIYQNEDLFTQDVIKKYAIKHKICAFEFSLDLSYFCDLIICDYNYVFDPKAHLIRYFDEVNEYSSRLLIDEAHNLVSRSKEMYSAELNMSLLYDSVDLMEDFDKSYLKSVSYIFRHLKEYDKLVNKELYYYAYAQDETLIQLLRRALNKIEVVLTDNLEFKDRDKLVDIYFNIKDLIDTSQFFSSNHIFIVIKEENNYIIKIECADASDFIYDTVKNYTKGAVLFSATLYPIKYHMDLLTKGNGKYITLESPFSKENLEVIIKDDISTKYKDREYTKEDIAQTINTIINFKLGNYIAFFPSYKYLELVKPYLNTSNYELVIQEPNMDDLSKEEYFNLFKDKNKNHLGLFVLGGSFSEGLDFIGDLLNGAIIVGVGLPQVNIFNNLLKEFFDSKYNGLGFEYAYTYPGFNKVIQAAGRVIRTETDKGVVVLIDERYKYRLYKSLMPSNWDNSKTLNNIDDIKGSLNNFYNKNQ